MIVLNLICRQQHRFEGWFASADAFDDQSRRGLVSCPFCNDAEIDRLPSGPRVINSAVEAGSSAESLSAVQEQLMEVLKTAVRDSENVGRRFPEEARKIHYKEAEPRNIRGIASVKEAHDLLDEGIVVVPLPMPPSDETH
jgi:hypothetical protein